MNKPSPRKRRSVSTSPIVTTGLFLLLLGGMALLFAWPWLPGEPVGGKMLHRYVPRSNGHTALYEIKDAAQQPAGWVSINQQNVPIAPGFLEMSEAELLALARLYDDDGFTIQLSARLVSEGARFFRLVSRRIDKDGRFQHQTERFILRSDAGDHLLWEINPAGRTSWIDPLPLFQAAQLPNGGFQKAVRTSRSDTVLVDIQYKALHSAVVNGRLYNPCITKTLWLDDAETRSIYCAEIGLVQQQRMSGDAPLETLSLVSHSEAGWLAHGASFPALPLPPQSPSRFSAASAGLTEFAQLQDIIGSSQPSIAPTFVWAEVPFVLAAQVEDGLGAYAAQGGEQLWFFKTGTTIFGQPAVDAARGRIYFGASDKKLYALDINGLFLWAVPTRDSVVTRPVVVGERLLFGSEDGAIRCVDVETGQLLGQIETGGAVVASPASGGKTAVFGSDDGGVYAVDAASCDLLWLFDAGDAVEAPLTIAQDVVYVVGRGLLAALSLQSGEPIWVQEPAEVYRFAPALLDDRLLLVDEFNQLSAFSRTDGRQLWTKGTPLFVGAPLAVADGVLLMGDEPTVFLVLPDGEISQRWTLPTDGLSDDPQLLFASPSSNGSVWFADNLSRIFVLSREMER